MSKVVLISCVSKKQKEKCKVRDFYISPLFKFNLKYASSLNPDKIFILSAKYGLIDLDKEIEPYDLTLNKMSQKEVESWAQRVIEELNKQEISDEEIKWLEIIINKLNKKLVENS
ncbi:hypothetical protein COV15_02825 [Candidatus Woesearchaeota archaeon CG10_big_fil_rev_8_21_14_0_10_34_12]|nr:MAG: hypothetical protein COV15_02825 [Candidatus Woesearchaeota archaeon CG10_big_fil_rev_8_21_14_0_10_34_12]